MNRTLKQDRELCIELAEKLGHEMGAWHWWFSKPRAICACKLCGDWAGLDSDRDWDYDTEDKPFNAKISGTAIEDNFEWRTERCIGVIRRGRERATWTKRYNKLLIIIKRSTPEEAAKIICGEKE